MGEVSRKRVHMIAARCHIEKGDDKEPQGRHVTQRIRGAPPGEGRRTEAGAMRSQIYEEIEGKIQKVEVVFRKGTHCWDTQGDAHGVAIVQGWREWGGVISCADKEGLEKLRPEP